MNVIGEGFVTGLLIMLAIGIAVSVAIGGVLLRLSVKWVAGFAPSWGRSFVGAFAGVMAALLVNGAIGSVVPLLLGFGGYVTRGPLLWAMVLVAFVLGLLVIAAAVMVLIPRPNGDSLGFGVAMRVAGVFAALCVGLYVVAAGLSILVLGGVPGVSR